MLIRQVFNFEELVSRQNKGARCDMFLLSPDGGSNSGDTGMLRSDHHAFGRPCLPRRTSGDTLAKTGLAHPDSPSISPEKAGKLTSRPFFEALQAQIR